MSRQYMDFAPRKASKMRSASKSGAVKVAGGAKTVRSATIKCSAPGAARPVRKAVKPAVKVAKPTRTVTKKQSASFSVKKEPALGVIEDLNPKFVNTNVPKRPLSQASHFRTQKTGVAAVKAKKVGIRGATAVEKPVENSKQVGAKGVYSTPKSPFINQNKVQKRPLSKNVYQKKVVVPKEEPKGPITIISKPEKQAHVGLIVTIILTIILGAAAGTVAFLLLPK